MDLRLKLARMLCPQTHRVIEVGDVVTSQRGIHSDLINGGDALARGWGCDPAILYNAAAWIAAAKEPT